MTREDMNLAIEASEKEKAQAAADLAAANKATDDAKAEGEKAVADVTAKLDSMAAERDQFRARLVEAEKERDDLKQMHADAKAEADKLRSALANPAHLDAVMKPAADASAKLSDAEADMLDKEAEAKAKADQPKTIREQYEAMAPGKERVAFLNAHRQEILG